MTIVLIGHVMLQSFASCVGITKEYCFAIMVKFHYLKLFVTWRITYLRVHVSKCLITFAQGLGWGISLRMHRLCLYWIPYMHIYDCVLTYQYEYLFMNISIIPTHPTKHLCCILAFGVRTMLVFIVSSFPIVVKPTELIHFTHGTSHGCVAERNQLFIGWSFEPLNLW